MEISKEREIIIVQIFYLFILPVLLLYFKVIPDQYRFVMLFFVSLLLLGIIHQEKWTFSDIGLKKKWLKDLIPYSFFTIAGILFIFWLSKISYTEPFLNWWENTKFLLLFIPISVFQEVVFRGILMKMLLQGFKQVSLVIFINAVVFSVLHIIYDNSLFILPLTFIGGIAFAAMYIKYRNLILISISHTIFNFVAMILGFFVIR